MVEESAERATSSEKKGIRSGITAAASFIALALAAYVLYLAFASTTSAASESLLMTWLNASVTQMKVWHLIVILYFVGILTRN